MVYKNNSANKQALSANASIIIYGRGLKVLISDATLTGPIQWPQLSTPFRRDTY